MNAFSDFQQLKKTVDDQGKIIREQALQITRLQDTVYQLLGGLYNHKKQGEMLAIHIAALKGGYSELDENECDDPDYYKHWPTTRQGDELEERMAEIEKKIATKDDVADLTVADLTVADLTVADLTVADLTVAGLTIKIKLR